MILKYDMLAVGYFSLLGKMSEPADIRQEDD